MADLTSVRLTIGGLLLFSFWLFFVHGQSTSLASESRFLFRNESRQHIANGSMSVIHPLPVASSSSVSGSTPDASTKVEYSWRAYDVAPEFSKRVRDQLMTCIIAKRVHPEDCDTLSSCSMSPEQCAYIEASAWDEIGGAAYIKLLKDPKQAGALLQSQAAWKSFAREECQLVERVFLGDPVLQKEEVARCAIRLSSERAISLRHYLEDTTK